MFWAYRFSYLEKMRREKQVFNERAWLQGAYFYEAMSVSLSQAFGNKQAKYRDEPYDLEGNKEENNTPKQNLLEEQLKARAKKIEKLLGGKDNGQHVKDTSPSKRTTSK